MRNSFLATAALCASVLSACAFAQVAHDPVDATPYNVSIKGGVFIPIDDNLRDVDSIFGVAGVEYLLPLELIRNSETFLEFDWIFHTTASSQVSLFPLTINQRFYTSQRANEMGYARRSYFFLGGGVSWVDPGGQMKLVGHAGVGTDIAQKIFVEASVYVGDSDNTGLRNTGVMFMIGYRF